jgi:carbon storage regulator
MLVLTRKRAEMIQIGEDIYIKVIRTGRSSVKIGVQAPDDVRVLRSELCDQPPRLKQPVKRAVDEADRAALVSTCSDQFPHPHLA